MPLCGNVYASKILKALCHMVCGQTQQMPGCECAEGEGRHELIAPVPDTLAALSWAYIA